MYKYAVLINLCSLIASRLHSEYTEKKKPFFCEFRTYCCVPYFIVTSLVFCCFPFWCVSTHTIRSDFLLAAALLQLVSVLPSFRPLPFTFHLSLRVRRSRVRRQTKTSVSVDRLAFYPSCSSETPSVCGLVWKSNLNKKRTF